MILRGIEATRYFSKPDQSKTGLLIFGVDAMHVALKRQEVIAALIGPEGENEMRLARIAASDLRKDPTTLLDAIRTQSFFPGPRVVFIENATDTLTATIQTALMEWRPGDAQIFVTAGGLTAKSSLKTLFEKHPAVFSIGLYDDPPSREEIETALTKAGITLIDREAMTDLTDLSRALNPGDFRQTLEKIALYKYHDTTPLSPTEVATLAPATVEAEVDDLIMAVAEGRQTEIAPLFRQLEAQGTTAVTLCIAALRHIRALHTAVTDPNGVSSGIAKARGIPFKIRNAMKEQASKWSAHKLEEAVALLVETDLTLRSASRAPTMAVMERALIRLAMMSQRRG